MKLLWKMKIKYLRYLLPQELSCWQILDQEA
ncbi:hypothetical protein Celaphus_00008416 [Cervus elaphus hippelaphus]|uniref:Uncharacterized protein n=1 Tax=Cervus elaphus hippelaphus TaxID=46360 RepID=A0A212CPJ2_CEREH|nr:hypothetical protein Celaphus_00008416 [Cervus elaphus hippelaphus]